MAILTFSTMQKLMACKKDIKIKLCDCKDQYTLKKCDYSYDIGDHPVVTLPDIPNYLVLQTSFYTGSFLEYESIQLFYKWMGERS